MTNRLVVLSTETNELLEIYEDKKMSFRELKDYFISCSIHSCKDVYFKGERL